MTKATVVRDFARRALWLYIAEAAIVLAIMMIARAHI
jgi:hypothetical protein